VGTAVFAKIWNGAAFVEELPSDASGDGISYFSSRASALTLTVDGSGNPFIAWADTQAAASDVHVMGNLFEVTGLFEADGTAGNTVQDILDANVLGLGDVILLTGNNAGGFTAGANHAGVLIHGSPGVSLTGPVVIEAGAAGVIVQRLVINGSVSVNGAAGFVLYQSDVSGGVTLTGGTGARIEHNELAGTIGVLLAGNPTDVAVESNAIGGTTGVSIASMADGRISNNQITSTGVGLSVLAAFSGSIDRNDISGATTGVNYAARAPLVANRIHNNVTGLISTVAGDVDGLGFALVGVPNEIHANGTGVQLTGQMQNQHVHDNALGVTGSGILGGVDLGLANLIEYNTAGVQNFDGTIQYNKIGNNGTGIVALADQKLFHNVIYRNTGVALQITGVSDVRVVNNTFYTATGDNIRIEGGSSEIEILNNILWTEAGYDIYLSDNSWDGFWSDYNNLYATGTGTLVHYAVDFTDILDWQADVSRFDLHSIGATVVDPGWAMPQFNARSLDDYLRIQN
jgi:hypothetical protein